MKRLPFTKEDVARAARMYRSNADAAAALGIAHGTFGCLCRRYGIVSPFQKRQERKKTIKKKK
ncbi:MAG: hypothetical protein HYT38_02765 [Candidatus Sungbacteria bacterium]|uniref:Uncharacterized protein n=1 Tax=Candidatus Sungiibacteriota bacterium TaxID=2750080 RepID=A0A9D6HST8_9BACT|nr:hypothetical protein [Candidatus Sungbacteria bacterium]